eukprot:Em0002g748a
MDSALECQKCDGSWLLLAGICGVFIDYMPPGASFVSYGLLLQVTQDPEIEQLSPKAIFKIIGNCSVILVALSNALATGSIYFFTPTLSPFLMKQFNLSPLYIGLVFIADSITYMIASVIIGPLLSHFSTRLLIIVGLLTCGVGFFCIGPMELIATPQLWIIIFSIAIIGFGGALVIMVSYADIMTTAKSLNTSYNTESLSAITSGIMFSSFSFGELLGPIVGGALNEIFDFQTSSMVIGVVILAQAVLMAIFSVCKCQ